MDKSIYIFNKTTKMRVVCEEESYYTVEILGENKTTLTARITRNEVEEGIRQGYIEKSEESD